MTTPKTWEELRRVIEGRGLDFEDQFWKAYDVLVDCGLAIVPREATLAMIKANMEPLGSVYPCPSNHTALIREWSAALSAGELAPPDKGEG